MLDLSAVMLVLQGLAERREVKCSCFFCETKIPSPNSHITLLSPKSACSRAVDAQYAPRVERAVQAPRRVRGFMHLCSRPSPLPNCLLPLHLCRVNLAAVRPLEAFGAFTTSHPQPLPSLPPPLLGCFLIPAPSGSLALRERWRPAARPLAVLLPPLPLAHFRAPLLVFPVTLVARFLDLLALLLVFEVVARGAAVDAARHREHRQGQLVGLAEVRALQVACGAAVSDIVLHNRADELHQRGKDWSVADRIAQSRAGDVLRQHA
eukprot:scaffold18788_cov62-Phaeocystis_antarctica.AAC.3